MLYRLALLLALFVPVAAAQPEAPLPFPRAAEVPALSEAAEVTLLTMMPGREVYSLFGHTALRVRDPLLGFDRTYNYGTFDFDQPYFLLRFLRGHLDYQLSVSTFERTLAEYRFMGRGVIEQKLALDAAERQALFRFLETNFLPENRLYRYDFLFDNCSTRPRDAVEWALGDRLSFGDYRPAGRSFRDLLQPYTVGAPLTDFGIDLGLGSPVDRTATPREAQFLPLELFWAFEQATVDGRPLVAVTDTLLWFPGPALPEPATDWPLWIAWGVFAFGLVLTLWGGAARRRVFDVVLLGVVGVAGIILAVLWLATEHHVTRFNLDVLWAWPTHLVAAIFVARRNATGGVRVYLAAAAAAALLTGLAAFFVASLHPAVAPLALLVAMRGGDRAWRSAPSPALRS